MTVISSPAQTRAAPQNATLHKGCRDKGSLRPWTTHQMLTETAMAQNSLWNDLKKQTSICVWRHFKSWNEKEVTFSFQDLIEKAVYLMCKFYFNIRYNFSTCFPSRPRWRWRYELDFFDKDWVLTLDSSGQRKVETSRGLYKPVGH